MHCIKYVLLLTTFISCAFISLNAQAPDVIRLDSFGQVIPADTVRQVDMVDYIAGIFKIKESEEKRSENKVNFSLFPSASSRTGSKTVVTSFNASFRLGDIRNTNASSVFFVPYVSFNGQYGFLLQPNIWLNTNRWNFTGDYFILSYPQNTWGLGGNSPEDNETKIDYNYLRIHQNAQKGIMPHLAVGLGYALDYHYDIDVEDTELGDSTEAFLPADRDYITSSGLTFSALYDTRPGPINPQRGVMGSVTYSFFSSLLGSTDVYQSLYMDVRKYFPLPGREHDVFAVRSYYWTIVTGVSPYLDLPSVRWEPAAGSSSRGIEQNRYRSNALLYFESEYRFGITANGFVGGVIFGSLTSASEYQTQYFKYWHPAGGAGLRLKFNKYSRTNVALDYGFSKGYSVFYLNIGEAF